MEIGSSRPILLRPAGQTGDILLTIVIPSSLELEPPQLLKTKKRIRQDALFFFTAMQLYRPDVTMNSSRRFRARQGSSRSVQAGFSSPLLTI